MNNNDDTLSALTERLLRLEQLYKDGVIDQQEYDNTKRNLLLSAETQQALGLHLEPVQPPQQNPETWVQHHVVFSGSVSEYFKIWITNVGLSIVTLGIYYAWAKVRTRQYFYAHTSLDGHNFFYHGKPLPILKANIILAAVSAVYAYANQVQNFWLLGAMLLLFYAVYPWMIAQSLRFNLANTSYKNIRFQFEGTDGKAYRYYLLAYFLVAVSGGLAAPFVLYKQRKWLLDNVRYGDLKTEFFGDVFKFYINSIVAGLIVGAPYFIFAFALGALAATNRGETTVVWWLVPLGVILSIAAVASHAYLQASNMVHSLEKTTMGKLRFTANYKMGDLVGIYITNALAVVFSLGLAIPWTKVRLNAYMLGNLVVWSQGPLPEVVAQGGGQVSTAGDAFTDAFGVDIAF